MFPYLKNIHVRFGDDKLQSEIQYIEADNLRLSSVPKIPFVLFGIIDFCLLLPSSLLPIKFE